MEPCFPESASTSPPWDTRTTNANPQTRHARRRRPRPASRRIFIWTPPVVDVSAVPTPVCFWLATVGVGGSPKSLFGFAQQGARRGGRALIRALESSPRSRARPRPQKDSGDRRMSTADDVRFQIVGKTTGGVWEGVRARKEVARPGDHPYPARVTTRVEARPSEKPVRTRFPTRAPCPLDEIRIRRSRSAPSWSAPGRRNHNPCRRHGTHTRSSTRTRGSRARVGPPLRPPCHVRR